MIGEIGEVVDILKKHGGIKSSGDADLRHDLIEELCDVLMYCNDIMMCFGITPEELKEVYIQKFQRNMNRW
jgi:NTP pyrophosphatase (non-canonical NTP hydrolase)